MPAGNNMADIKWYINRLRAMSLSEVKWRIGQKRLENAERKAFENRNRAVSERVFYQGKEDLIFHMEKLCLPTDCGTGQNGNVCDGRKKQTTIPLLGGFDYQQYKTDWHAGFQTEKKWPLEFSHDLQYKQRDDIGDARTNWELNRHFQFALLACRYYVSKDEAYLKELEMLFTDWNQKNPFLTGISWTSVMEAAIRDINWIYALGFLQKSLDREEKIYSQSEKREGAPLKKEIQEETKRNIVARLCEGFRHGIVNMSCYIAGHYSRYSSANNHVIVEAAALGLAGIVMDCEEWQEEAFFILKREIPRQNYRDGVNKEVSLHYQSFFMEAVGLLTLVWQKNGRQIPMAWRDILTNMSRYLKNCQGAYGECVVFGDDDEGKILDVTGKERNHYEYVLQLMSLILPERYTEAITEETLCFLTEGREREKVRQKPLYEGLACICYEEGGVSVLRDKNRTVLIGIDHGALGFGSIAAHGHADALSFQMYLEGKPLFADAGTYIYHTDLESRNAFRRTINHNTVTIDGKDQSEMLGAFLWGKRAETVLLEHNLQVGGRETVYKERENTERKGLEWETGNGSESEAKAVEAYHNGYEPVIHRRKFIFDENGSLQIQDRLAGAEKALKFQVNFLLGPDCIIERTGNFCRENGSDGKDTAGEVFNKCMEIVCGSYRIMLEAKAAGELAINIAEAYISFGYGIRKKTKQIQIKGTTEKETEIVTKIRWEKVQ